MAKDQIENIELELKQLELEEKRADVEAKKIRMELDRWELGNLKQQLEMKTSNKKRGQADALKAIEDLKAVQERCNHHTGGHGPTAILQGQGDPERPTCIGAQQFLDDRIRLTCQRCRAVCWSDDPDRAKWAYWVNLWRKSINKQMMVIGGLKMKKVETP